MKGHFFKGAEKGLPLFLLEEKKPNIGLVF
jgi:hypothetical protein